MRTILASRFTLIMEIPDSVIPRDPAKHIAQWQVPMNAVKVNASGQTAWYIAKLTDKTSLDYCCSSEEPLNNYHVIYVNLNMSVKIVAAPCPPFCQQEQG